MDFLAKSSRWLERTRTRKFAHRVLLRRASSSVTVTATASEKKYTVVDDTGLQTAIESRDYLIDVWQYKFDGIPTEPAAGDQIIENFERNVNGSGGQIFEVMGIKGMELFQYHDLNREVYRVHTRFVGTLP